MATILAIFGLLMAIESYDRGIKQYDVDGIDINRNPDPNKHPRVTDAMTCVYRATILVTTCLSITCLFFR